MIWLSRTIFIAMANMVISSQIIPERRDLRSGACFPDHRELWQNNFKPVMRYEFQVKADGRVIFH